MAMLGNPCYEEAKALNATDIKSMSKKELIYSYTIIKGKFEFPPSVKYPSIPCYIDETTTVYPRAGECILTGAEYLVAKDQGCKIEINEGFKIPFESLRDEAGKEVYDSDGFIMKTNHPFKNI